MFNIFSIYSSIEIQYFYINAYNLPIDTIDSDDSLLHDYDESEDYSSEDVEELGIETNLVKTSVFSTQRLYHLLPVLNQKTRNFSDSFRYTNSLNLKNGYILKLFFIINLNNFKFKNYFFIVKNFNLLNTKKFFKLQANLPPFFGFQMSQFNCFSFPAILFYFFNFKKLNTFNIVFNTLFNFLPTSIIVDLVDWVQSENTTFNPRVINSNWSLKAKFFFFINQLSDFDAASYNLNFFFFFNFFNHFLSFFFNEKCFLKIQNIASFFFDHVNFLNFLKTKMSKKLKTFHFTFFTDEFFEVLIFSFRQKNLTVFMQWFRSFFEKLPFIYHKKFLQLFSIFFKLFFIYFANEFNIKGFYLNIKGKISVGGNAKKRQYTIVTGTVSKSLKKNCFFFDQNQVRTITGVLGLTYILTY